MNYSDAIAYLYKQAPTFQKYGKQAYKSGLENTLWLDQHFGHPHRNYRTIHVAGTNGKGSTSHLLASVLQCAGYKVGLYTSPHIHDFCERIRVDGKPIPHERVADFITENTAIIEQIAPSFFEITTALAFLYFAEQKVDVAVIEVGLGGRLDCTNIITPELSVITNISLDHTDILGDTFEKIATEKAGIIKPNVPVVIGETQTETQPVFEKIAEENNSDIVFADKIERKTLPECALKGIYQDKNSRTVLAAIDVLRKRDFQISDNAISEGFLRVVELTHLQGRWQVLCEKPLVVCDSGHNVGGITYVAEQLKQSKYNHLYIVFGMVSDKDVKSVLALLPTNATYFFTQADSPRAIDAKTLQEMASTFGLEGGCYGSVKQAFDSAIKMANADDLVFVGGSNYVLAELDF